MSDDLYYWSAYGDAPENPGDLEHPDNLDDDLTLDPWDERPELPPPAAPKLDYASLLNPAQLEAVTTTEGPLLVVAGAGSGKTRTLVHRVAYLVERGVAPEAILLLTFTRKAAAQMLSRAGQLVGSACDRVSGGTFHSLAHDLLRRHAARLGYPPDFGVMDRGDMEEVLGRLRKEHHFGEKDKRFPKRSTVATIISKAANKSLPLDKLMAQEFVHLLPYVKDIRNIAGLYQEYKRYNALFDFDDLLVELAKLLTTDEEGRRRIAGRYRYVMVDEYQDTNTLQADIVEALARDHQNVMVVGDDAQSIYSFRGASFRNIMEFPKRFSGTRIIRLEENYRSTQPILDVTNQIIARAREKYDKKLFTRRTGGVKPKLILFSTTKEQSLFVCEQVRRQMGQGKDLGRMAVLFRAASHSFDLELELARNEIPFVKHGGRRFLEAAHVKDLLALLRVSAHPGDALSLSRAVMMIDGVGPQTATEIGLWVGGRREKLVALDQYDGRARTREALKPLAGLMSAIAAPGVLMADRIEQAWAFYRPIMETRFDDHPHRLADIKEFLRLAEGYTNLIRFLADMTLEPPNASVGPAVYGDRALPLTLSTVHSAKGLEWEVVFILWAVDGRFPMVHPGSTPDDLDEERRLLYVAATRAEQDLFFLCPLETDDYRYYTTRPRPSRFLGEVPARLFSTKADDGDPSPAPAKGTIQDKGRNPGAGTRAPESEAPARTSGRTVNRPPSGGYVPGARVSHPVFGLGKVVERLDGKKIKVDFDHFGVKTLHLDYAGLKGA